MTRRGLLVGDPPIAALCREFFENVHGDGYAVETVEYCDDALALLRRRPFDFVLVLSLYVPWRVPFASDIFGPFTGITLLKQMQAANIQVPVLVASSNVLSRAKEAALGNGAVAFIEKPFEFGELDRLVALALSHDEGRPIEG